MSFDGVELVYVDMGTAGRPIVYSLRHLIADRVTPADSACFGNPVGFDEHTVSSLAVYACCLANSCQDVLAGAILATAGSVGDWTG